MHIQETIENGLQMLRGLEKLSDDEKAQLRREVVTEWMGIEANVREIGMDSILQAFEKCDLSDVRIRVFVLSWLHMLSSDTGYIEKLLMEVLDSDFSVEELYFVMSQVQHLFFSNPEYELTDRVEDLLDDVYKRIIATYREKIEDELQWIPSSERNYDFVLVITDQLLKIQHGPTKTTLDRCKILMEDMGKDVLLINSGTAVPWDHLVLMRNLGRGNYLDQYLDAEEVKYESVSIPFIQMENRLPSFEEARAMVDLVKQNKPYQIVVVGGGFYEELFDSMVPVLNISLAPSKLTRTFVSYQQIGRPINDYDRRFLKYRGLPEDHIISDVFTSHLAEQMMDKGREELGLPQEGDIAVAVGGRLSTEINEKYIKMIIPCLERGLYLLLLGDVEHLLPRLEKWAGEMFSRIICPGTVTDPLAYLDHCFLYVNPRRMGGGTSCVEAMSKSVPVVTIAYGDVYVNTGEEFGVPDYESMQKEILHHMEDAEYHEKMAESAKRRADIMLDSSGAFVRIMKEYEKRMLSKEGA